MYYSFKNSTILLNNTGVLANTVDVAETATAEPAYSIGDKYSTSYSAENGIGGSLRFSYYLTGRDFLKEFTTNETNVISGYFGGLFFKSGYLTSYSLNATPNNPPVINAEVSFFDQLKGSFSPTYTKADEQNFLSFSDATFTNIYGQVIATTSQINSLTYNFTSNVEPVYTVGDITPINVIFGPKEIKTSLETDILDGNLNISGEPIGVIFNFRHPSYQAETQSYTTSGILFERSIGTAVGKIITSNLSIKQHQVDDQPSISSISPVTAAPGEGISIAGFNLQTTTSVYVGRKPASFTAIGNTGLNVIVPSGALSTEISVQNYVGTATSSSFTVNQPAITIDSLIPPTGTQNTIIRISGSQFYSVDSVIFTNNKSGNFTTVSPSLIDVTVPYGASRGTISIGSKDRGTTGTSSQIFVPKPIIEGFLPTSGLSGITISISGNSLSGITGVCLNNLGGSFTVIENTGINFIVPSGNTKGVFKVSGESGLLGYSLREFLPLVNITSLSPSSGKTGTAIAILGENFQPSNMASPSTNNYLVGFQNASGLFTRTNSQRLDGNVPYGAQSGLVYAFAPDYSSYPSIVAFTLLYDDPIVTSSTPLSGQKSSFANINGDNFYNIRNLSLTGNGTGSLIDSNSLIVSTLGNVISFTVPNITGGKYDAIVTSRDGIGTGSNIFTILDKPHISGVSMPSGIVGQQINLSGLNFYPESKLYHFTTGYECQIISGSLSLNYDFLSFKVPTTPNSTGYLVLDNTVDVITGSDFNVIFKPEISGFTGGSGAWESQIQVTGLYLNNTTSVFVGDYQATSVTAISSTGLFFNIPLNATSDYIYISGSGGLSVSQEVLAVATPPPIISGFTPTSLRPNREVILISGWYFNTIDEVLFSGSGIEISVTGGFITGIGTTGLRLIVPQFTTGNFFKVKNDDFAILSSSELTILPVPQITNFGPTSGVFAQTIEITGYNFTASNTAFCFQSFTGLLVSGENTVINSSTKGTCRIPREIFSGPIIASGNSELINSNLIFTPLPTISGMNPSTGIGETGYIRITGINAHAVAYVGISGENTFANLVNNSTIGIDTTYRLNPPGNTTGVAVITAQISNQFIGSGAVCLITSGDHISSNLSDITGSETWKANQSILFHYLHVSGIPQVSGFTPLSGNANSSIIISGDRLSTSTGILFTNGIITTTGQITAQTRNSISVTPGPFMITSSGQVTVLSRYGNASSTQYFCWLENPSITSILPLDVATGYNFFVLGSGLEHVTGIRLSGNYNSFNVNFTIGYSGSNFNVTGTVPDVTDLINRNYKVVVYNPAGTSTSNQSLNILFGDEVFYGNIISSGYIGATGITILPSGLQSGITFYSILSGNYLIFNCKSNTQDWRCFSQTI